MTSVSVAMATFNGARFIREQLNSIAAQTALPAELVITDDCSTDDTLAIARDFARTAPFPVHIHANPVRLGYRANFMGNTRRCRGALIALCDQDDVWAPAKLETMLASFAHDPDVLLSFHEAWLANSVGERTELARIYSLKENKPSSSLFPLHNPYGFSMVFRRELLEFSDLWDRSVDNLFTDTMMAHDQWFFFLASALGTIGYVGEPLADYRQHGANTYGLDRPATTVTERINRWINVRSKDYAHFAVAAEVRASILEEASGRLDGEWLSRARSAVVWYRDLARRCALRAAAYQSTGVFARLGAWRGMLRAGDYDSNRKWTFGRKAALVDLACLISPGAIAAALAGARRGAARTGSDSTAS